MTMRAEKVFKPGAYPTYTYVSRHYEDTDISYELRLKQALRTAGCLTSIIGPSKMGKTILCEKVIGLDNIVEISGADFNENTDFWATVAAKVELPYMGEITTERFSKTEEITDRDGKNEKYVLSKDKIIEYYKKENLVLVIDDFHYAPKEKRMQIAQQLKDAIRRGFKAIVVSLPHRADEAIRQNADLSGRLSLINMDSWKVEDLKEIAKKGFSKLNIKIADEIAEQIAVESLSSPQLMQYICLNICSILEMNENKEKSVGQEILKTAYHYTTANFEYGDVVLLMKKGPSTRGKSRNTFQLKNGQLCDLYELIVKSIAENPPIMQLTFEDVKERIYSLISDESKKPTPQAIKESLTKLQELLHIREDIFKVLDWKDDILYILDPLFLFYLRWGGSLK